MREIKFRAWFDRDKQMFYNVGYHPTILEFHEDHENNGEITVCPMANGYHIMQFTGLKDKNGVEIYEGDIIRSFYSTGDPCIHYVKYFERVAAFGVVYKNQILEPQHMPIDQEWIYDHNKEIIGNLYQNPELINNL